MRLSFATRLALALAALLLAFGVVAALLAQWLAADHAQAAQQRLSIGLARHIADRWPQIDRADGRAPLIAMLQAVNPGVQVYVLDRAGRVEAYLGEPGMVRRLDVDLAPLQRFADGAPLPLRGTDPMGSGRGVVFSAATLPTGWLYVVLDGAAPPAPTPVARLVPLLAAGVLVVTALAGALLLRRLTRPLRRLALRLQAYSGGAPGPAAGGDELQALEHAFDGLRGRVEAQAAAERDQARAHRETLAGVAHDLRTPLTALHGQLEAMATGAGAPASMLPSALAQSRRLRRLTEQLFELATLQDAERPAQRERFRLDELVQDTVQHLSGPQAAVQMCGPPPGALEVVGDLQLVERALANLIDNACRHAGAVQVRLDQEGGAARVTIEDRGPGLPPELHRHLSAGQPLRERAHRRAGGGIGGLGLAIAQRVAQLHGGSLLPLPTPDGGTRLCLRLPLAR
jgi:signal transduction histidine kinase